MHVLYSYFILLIFIEYRIKMSNSIWAEGWNWKFSVWKSNFGKSINSIIWALDLNPVVSHESLVRDSTDASVRHRNERQGGSGSWSPQKSAVWQVEGGPHTDGTVSTSLVKLFIFSQLLILTKGRRKNISFSKIIFSFPFCVVFI